MRAQVVTRCEVYMNSEEQHLFKDLAEYIESIDEEEWDAIAEPIKEMLTNIMDNCYELLELIPDEH